MKYQALPLIFLFSVMLCMASGCTAFPQAAGSVLHTISPSPPAGPEPSTSGAPHGETPEPGVPDTVSPVPPETTAPPPVTTTPVQVTSPTTTVTFAATPVTTSTTAVTTLATAVTTPATTVTTPPTTIPAAPEGDIPRGVELAVFRLTNEERARNGVAPLAWDDPLAGVARDHSTDMAEHHFFSHTNLQGEGPTERAQRMGYPTRKDLGGGWYSEGIGENINQMPAGNVVGYGYVDNDAESVARAAVKAFMDSPGHRALILKGEFTNIGVGVAYDGTYYYTTQNFW